MQIKANLKADNTSATQTSGYSDSIKWDPHMAYKIFISMGCTGLLRTKPSPSVDSIFQMRLRDGISWESSFHQSLKSGLKKRPFALASSSLSQTIKLKYSRLHKSTYQPFLLQLCRPQ